MTEDPSGVIGVIKEVHDEGVGVCSGGEEEGFVREVGEGGYAAGVCVLELG